MRTIDAAQRQTTAPRWARGAGLALLSLVALSGCAERRLVTKPATPPTTGTWIAVWIAGAVIAVVAGGLLTLPVWRERGGSRVATAVLALQAGALAVAGAVLTGVAVRGWQLIERPESAAPAGALLRLSRLDGDTAYLALMVLFVVVVTALLVTLSALAARFAASTDVLERSIACAVLAVEVAGAAYATARLLRGAHGWPYLGSALALPVFFVAFLTAWPRGTKAAKATPQSL